MYSDYEDNHVPERRSAKGKVKRFKKHREYEDKDKAVKENKKRKERRKLKEGDV